MATTIDILSAEVQECIDRIDLLTNVINNAVIDRLTYNNAMTLLETQIDDLRTELQALDTRVSLLETKVTNLESTVADHEARLAAGGL